MTLYRSNLPFLFCVSIVVPFFANADARESVAPTLPSAPIGFEWQRVENMSDEFTGNALDRSKWNNYIATWRGRPPAEFLPENISVENGSLKVKTSTHPKPNTYYTIAGGAVSGRHRQTYGYFEARIKASRTKMSTTFWLHSDDDEKKQEGCAKRHGIELDILEMIGGWPTKQWTNFVNSNTHYKPYAPGKVRCQQLKYLSKGNKHDTGVHLADDFHVYSAWWVTPNTFHFYFDGQKTATVVVDHERDKRPFNGPMSLRMVAETYDWQPKFIPEGMEPYPTAEELDDPRINAIAYDYVRTYKLVPDVSNIVENPDFEKGKKMRPWKRIRGQVRLGDMSFEGSAGLHIGSGGETRQKLKVKPGSAYRLSVYAMKNKQSDSDAHARLAVLDKKRNVLAQTTLTGSEFTQHELIFDTKKNKTIYISISNMSSSDIMIDNVSVMPTQEGEISHNGG